MLLRCRWLARPPLAPPRCTRRRRAPPSLHSILKPSSPPC